MRKTGYALEDEQCEAGMRSLAAPIRDAEGRVVAAVGIAGPRQRLSEDVLENFAPEFLKTARHLRPPRFQGGGFLSEEKQDGNGQHGKDHDTRCQHFV